MTLPRALARVTAITAAALSVTVVIGGPVPAAAADPCSDVEIVFARGTSEPIGVGRVGQAFADALQPLLGGRSVSTYAVNYPATYDFLTTAEGAADASARVAAMAAQCPATRIVLGGYSQGAAVVDMLAGVPPLGGRIGNIGSASPLPAGLTSNVAAVAVFGNPATKFGNPVSASGLFAGKAVDLCSDGDPVCSDGRNPFAHTHYESSPFINEAANFVAGMV